MQCANTRGEDSEHKAPMLMIPRAEQDIKIRDIQPPSLSKHKLNVIK